MGETVEVPLSLIKKMARTPDAFAKLEDELEDYLLARTPEFVSHMREVRAAHLAGNVRPLADLKREQTPHPLTPSP